MPTSLNTTLPEVQTLAMQLPAEERWALLKTLVESLQPESQAAQFIDLSVPSSDEMMALAHAGKSFDFLADEPDLYTIADGEPIE
jgi:anion-transporting  ArsA/GET3 family ATPase